MEVRHQCLTEAVRGPRVLAGLWQSAVVANALLLLLCALHWCAI